MLVAGPLPPLVEVLAADDVLADTGVVELEEGVLVDDDVAAPGPVLELLGLLQQAGVVGQEAVARVPLPLHEGVPDEELARQWGVDPPEVDQPVGDQRDAVQGDALARHDRGTLARPVRLGIGALDEVVAEALGPLGLDRGVLTRPQPRGLDELGTHQEGRVAALEHAAGEDGETGVAGADVLAHRAPLPRLGLVPLLERADVAEQTGQQCLVDAVLVGGVGGLTDLELHLLGHLAQLGLVVLPLADPHVVEELALAHPAERARRQLALLLLDVAPQVEPGEEVARLVLEAGVQLVGLRAVLLGTLAGVLDRQGRGNDQDVAHAAEALGLDDHPAQPRVDRQPRQALADLREADAGPPLRIRRDRTELLQQLDAGRDVAPVGGLDEREPRDVPEAERRHLQDDAGQVGPQDLGIGERRAALEVLLGVEPDRDAVGDATAATRPLVGRGLADRLDRQPLDLGPHGVAADARDTGVHDVPDAGDGQRRLGDVGGEHHPAHRRGVAGEHLVLVGGAEPGVERDDLEPVTLERIERVRGVADLPLTRKEDQHVTGPVDGQLADRLDDRLGLVALDRLAVLVVLRQLEEGAVADVDGIGPPRHLDDRCAEVGGEAVDVDGGAGDDHLQVGPPGKQPPEVAQQEVDVEAALVGLVDDDRVVLAEVTVALQLGQQDAVGHQLDPARLARAVGEPHLVADDVAQLGAQLLGDPLGHRAGRDPSRLRVADQTTPVGGARAASELEADLGELRRLPRPGLPRDDHDLVVANGRRDVVTACGDRELGGIGDVHNGGHSRPRPEVVFIARGSAG